MYTGQVLDKRDGERAGSEIVDICLAVSRSAFPLPDVCVPTITFASARFFVPVSVQPEETYGHLSVRLPGSEETGEIPFRFRYALALTTLLMRQCQPSGVIVVVYRQRRQEERNGGGGGSEVGGAIDVASFDDLPRRRNVALYTSFDEASFDVVSFDELSTTGVPMAGFRLLPERQCGLHESVPSVPVALKWSLRTVT